MPPTNTKATSRVESPHIPENILDLFVQGLSQYLNENDAHGALVACSLTSHSLGALARKRLLANITVSNGVPSLDRKATTNEDWESARRLRLLSLVRLLDSDSDFKSLIRKVHLKLDAEGTQQETGPQDFSGLDSVLYALSSRAKNIETFWLIGNLSMAWSHLVEHGIDQSIVNLLTSVKLQGLRFSNLAQVPLDILSKCLSIRCLELYDATFQIETASHPPSMPIRLEELSIHPNPARKHKEWLSTDLFELSGLRRLTFLLAIALQSSSHLKNMVRKAESSIECLDLTVDLEDFGHGNLRKYLTEPFLHGSPIDIGKLPKLHDLTLRTEWGGYVKDTNEDLFDLLNCAKHPTQLKYLQLLFKATFELKGLNIAKLPPDEYGRWTALNPATLLKKHPHLKTLSVNRRQTESSMA